jgi:hypothetical protein
MRAISIPNAILSLFCVVGALSAQDRHVSQYKVGEALDVAEVVSDFRVGFCLLTEGRHQFAAYYDKDRSLTVASRTLDSKEWTYQNLPTRVGWDSHNYITMAVDRTGHLHVSGNMHAVKLIYFRSEKPWDITTLKRFEMTGEQENRATYPKFLTDPQGRLVFNYRDGGSGRGKRIYNRYDTETRTWSRMLDTPLLDGEGQRNAYPSGPSLGQDGFYHMVWVWRDTPDCATNHHLSYARSRDLIDWESAFGEVVPLPIVLGERQTWVDPIPSGGGIINGGARLSFDRDGRPLIAYHKSDPDGHMQIYVARPEDGRWVRHQLTDWNQPVKFSGNGSMGDIGIQISHLVEAGPGRLTMTYQHRDYGSGRLVIDETTLAPLDEKIDVVREYPKELDRAESDFEGMRIRRSHDLGESGDESVRYMLQWESLGANRDKKPPGPLPEPAMLRLYKLSKRE